LPPPEGFEVLAGEGVSRHHKHAIPFFIGDVNHAQIAPLRRLPEGLPGAAGTRLVLAGMRQNPFRFGFGHPVVVDVWQSGFGSQ
jgi:hypothetical protein